MKHKKIKVPTGGTLPVYSDKPPKVRFLPGNLVKRGDQIYEIIYVFRVKTDSTVWRYCLEERQGLNHHLDSIGQFMECLGLGSTTPRIVYDCFRDEMDAQRFFMDIPANGNRLSVTNKTILREFKLVSTGEVIE